MEHKDHNSEGFSRRSFLSKSSAAAIGLLAAGPSLYGFAPDALKKPNSKFAGVQIGTITYSYRSMPHDIHQLLKMITDSGISAVELMGEAVEDFAGKPKDKDQWPEWRANVGMKKFKEVRKMFKKAGVSIYAFKPSALGGNNTDEEIEYAMRAGKALGANSVTVELPKDPKQSLRLGTLAAKNKIYVGYHNHTQATDTVWDVALDQSPYNSINLDFGHYIAAGGNNTVETLLAFIENKHHRITSMHMKDRQNKVNGQANLPWGQGDTPIVEVLQLLRDKKYRIPVSIELEYEVPAGSDAVKEVRKCREYAREALEG